MAPQTNFKDILPEVFMNREVILTREQFNKIIDCCSLELRSTGNYAALYNMVYGQELTKNTQVDHQDFTTKLWDIYNNPEKDSSIFLKITHVISQTKGALTPLFDAIKQKNQNKIAQEIKKEDYDEFDRVIAIDALVSFIDDAETAKLLSNKFPCAVQLTQMHIQAGGIKVIKAMIDISSDKQTAYAQLIKDWNRCTHLPDETLTEMLNIIMENSKTINDKIKLLESVQQLVDQGKELVNGKETESYKRLTKLLKKRKEFVTQVYIRDNLDQIVTEAVISVFGTNYEYQDYLKEIIIKSMANKEEDIKKLSNEPLTNLEIKTVLSKSLFDNHDLIEKALFKEKQLQQKIKQYESIEQQNTEKSLKDIINHMINKIFGMQKKWIKQVRTIEAEVTNNIQQGLGSSGTTPPSTPTQSKQPHQGPSK